MGRRRLYTKEFKESAIELYHSRVVRPLINLSRKGSKLMAVKNNNGCNDKTRGLLYNICIILARRLI